MHEPNILVFDSGLGGLTVYDEITKLRPHANYLYVADDAAFPYGRLSEAQVIDRVNTVMSRLIAETKPAIVIIACNTASTLVLPHLREKWPDLPFVGTVPAIKPAAELSETRVITVLATPGTVTRDYTQALIRDHAAHCHVTLIGSDQLASLAEAHMHGDEPADDDIIHELAPCFIEHKGKRTDQIVLACTHYPLLLPRFAALAGKSVGWKVNFIDPAPAIARQTDRILSQRGYLHTGSNDAADGESGNSAFFTSGVAPDDRLLNILSRYGLKKTREGCISFAGL